jgi:hypothetical protein
MIDKLYRALSLENGVEGKDKLELIKEKIKSIESSIVDVFDGINTKDKQNRARVIVASLSDEHLTAVEKKILRNRRNDMIKSSFGTLMRPNVLRNDSIKSRKN